MRVLHVYTDLRGGGIEAMITTLAVATKDVEPAICWCPSSHPEPPVEFVTGLEHRGIRLFRIPPPFLSGRYPWRLGRVIHDFCPHVLHLHGATLAIVGGLVGRLLRVPAIVYTEHLQHAFLPGWLRRLREVTARLPHWTVFVARAAREEAVGSGGPLSSIRGRSGVIYNGIDLAPYKEQSTGRSRAETTARQPEYSLCQESEERKGQKLRTELGLGSGSVLLGCVGLLWRAKGQEFLVRALPLIQDRLDGPRQPAGADVHVVLIGSGHDETMLRCLAEELSIDDRLHLLGWRSDIPHILDALDIYVQPSITEGLPLAVVEACASGLPVVASRVGGIPEIVQHEVDGVLVPPGDADALANAVVALIKAPSRARTLARSARVRAFELFSAETMAASYQELYAQLLAEKTT